MAKIFDEAVEAIVKAWIPFDNGSSDRIALRYTIHKHLDPVRTIDAVLPVAVGRYEADSVYAGQEVKSLSIDEDIAADFINRVARGRE